MSIVSDLVDQIVKTVLSESMRKLGGKRRRRRLTPTERIARQIGDYFKPAKRQVSRKRTVRARSKVKRRG